MKPETLHLTSLFSKRMFGPAVARHAERSQGQVVQQFHRAHHAESHAQT